MLAEMLVEFLFYIGAFTEDLAYVDFGCSELERLCEKVSFSPNQGSYIQDPLEIMRLHYSLKV
jgi:hypothetical protein